MHSDWSLEGRVTRSRFNAGTRYIKRGINSDSKVANDVETELFVVEDYKFENKIKSIQAYTLYRGGK